MNPIKKIMSTKYKYAFVAAIIMIVVFLLGIVVIQGMTNVITEQQITYTDTIVSNKFLDESNDHFYIIVGNDNKTFDIDTEEFLAMIDEELYAENGGNYEYLL